MPTNGAQKANTINQAINQNFRKQKLGSGSGGVGGTVSIDYGTPIEYVDAMEFGQMMAIVDGKAYNPSVVFANAKPACAICALTGDAGTVGYYKNTLQVVTASGTQGALYLSSTLPYYSNTPLTANGAAWQVVGRRIDDTLALLCCEPAVEVEYEPEDM